MIRKSGLLLFVLILLLNCGKKGPLFLEPELIPKEAANLQISQVGENLRLTWDFPAFLADKKRTPLEVEKIDKIYVYYSEKEILGGKFQKKSTLLKKLKFEDLTYVPPPFYAALQTSGGGKPQSLTYFTDIPFKLKDLDNKNHFFGIQYFYQKKRSPLSAVAFIVTATPMKPVTDIKLIQENKLIKLSWSKPQADIAGKRITDIAGYNIYRKVEPEVAEGAEANTETLETEKETFEKINRNNILNEYYEDMDTGNNGTYSYYVSTVISNQIESAPSQTVTIKVTDIYPPEVPANLVCFKAQDHLFLTWKPVMDTDFSHYRVYRRTPNNKEFQLIADKITATSYKDNDLKPDKTYFYTVTAVDAKGNESNYSNEVKEQF